MHRLLLLLVVSCVALHPSWSSIVVAQQGMQQVAPHPVGGGAAVPRVDQYFIKTHLVRLNRTQAARAKCFAVLDAAEVDRTKLIPLSRDVESQLRVLQKARAAKTLANPVMVTVAGRPASFTTGTRTVADESGKPRIEQGGRMLTTKVTPLEDSEEVKVSIVARTDAQSEKSRPLADREPEAEKTYTGQVTLGEPYLLIDAFVHDPQESRIAASDDLVVISIERVR